MMENKKIALLEKSLTSNPNSNDTAELDKLNMSFFETLLPALREVNNQDTLLCRNDLTRVVFNYAYKNVAWKSLSDSASQISTTPVTQRFSSTQPKRRKLEDENGKYQHTYRTIIIRILFIILLNFLDCQIVSVIPTSHFNTPIKAEEKYRPTSSERYRNRRRRLSAESIVTQLELDQCAHVSASTPSNWTNQYYNNNNNNQQFTPQYSGQQHYLQPVPNNIYWQNHGAMTRQMASATITEAQNSMNSNTTPQMAMTFINFLKFLLKRTKRR